MHCVTAFGQGFDKIATAIETHDRNVVGFLNLLDFLLLYQNRFIFLLPLNIKCDIINWTFMIYIYLYNTC